MSKYVTTFIDLPNEHREKNTHAFFGISLLQDFNYGEGFTDVVNLIVKTFKKKYILISDTPILYTYLSLGYSLAESKKLRDKEVKNWKSSPHVKKALDGLDKDTTLLSISEIIEKEDFEDFLHIVESQFEKNTSFHNLVNLSISNGFATYIDRYKHRINLKNFNPKESLHFCKKYLLIECAIFLYIINLYGIDESLYHVYPISRSSKSNTDNVISCFKACLDFFKPSKVRFAYTSTVKNKTVNDSKPNTTSNSSINFKFIPISRENFENFDENMKTLILNLMSNEEEKEKIWQHYCQFVAKFIPNEKTTANVIDFSKRLKK